MKPVLLSFAGLFLLALVGCDREERGFEVSPPDAQTIGNMSLTDLHAGAATQPVITGAATPVKNEYEENAYALSQGQQLFSRFNCGTCHAHVGGGDIGPPLLDDKWIYGSNPEQIFATIVEGRPNGMPAFRGKMPNYQVWQLTAYVRSLSGMVNKNAAPGREDHMKTPSPPNTTPPQRPATAESVPNGAEGH